MRSDLTLALLALLTSIGSAAEPTPFPYGDLLPKRETGAARLLEKHPTWDGRGVVVAVLDTGVDPAAPGLRTTTTGRPKILDLIDGSGAGDVACEREATPEAGRLTGVSGRSLRAPQGWIRPGRVFRLGFKRAYDLFPDELVRRLRRERRREFERRQQGVENELLREIAAAEAAGGNSVGELRERLAQLRAMRAEYEDPGPLLDCVLFHDGRHWRVAIDTDEDGDLGDETLLEDFSLRRRHASFPEPIALNFAVHVYNEGRLLSIVCDTSGHGTHVAGIIGAHYPDRPELNGIAPGAQIVSIQIGDTRLGTMETERALERAAIAIRRHGCDIASMSYGEPAAGSRGRLGRMLERLAEEWEVLFLAAAGNEGPGLQTVIAPGGIQPQILGIGAFLSPEARAAQYSLPPGGRPMLYTWSSRGPAGQGGRGVDLAAPGGAFAPVPPWTRNSKQQMHGTSMATPNASGNAALLISALKQRKVPYTVVSLQRGLRNTAERQPGLDDLGQGAGLIQVDRAVAAAARWANAPLERIALQWQRDGESTAGLVLRETADTNRRHRLQLRLRPQLPREAVHGDRTGIETPLRLESSQPWVTTGESLLLTHGGARVGVAVDPRELPPGLHLAEVRVLDPERPDRAPLTTFPITVLKPATADSETSPELRMAPGDVRRRFVAVPEDARFVELQLSAAVGGEFLVDLVQQSAAGKMHQNPQRLRVPENGRVQRRWPVLPGRTLELCVARNWNAVDGAVCQLAYRFERIDCHPRRIEAAQSDPVAAARITTDRAIPMKLSAQLDRRRRLLPPLTRQLSVSSDPRDQLPGKAAVHILKLRYAWDQAEATQATLLFPRTQEWLYESPEPTPVWSLYNEHGSRLTSGERQPVRCDLPVGRLELRLELRGRDRAELAQTPNWLLAVETPLQSPLPVRVAESPLAAATDQSLTRVEMAPDAPRVVYLATGSIAVDKLDLRPGDQLLGEFVLADPSNVGRRVENPVVINWQAANELFSPRPAPQSQTLGDALFAARLEHVTSLPGSTPRSDFERHAEKLVRQARDPRQRQRALAAKLAWLDDPTRRKQWLDDVVAACDAVLATIDEAALTLHFGQRRQAGPDHDRMLAERELLRDTLYRKGRALGYMELPDVLAKRPIPHPQQHNRAFEENFARLQRWADTTTPRFGLLHVRWARRRGNRGESLRLLHAFMRTDPGNYWYYKKRRDLCEELGWEHWREYHAAWLVIRFPDRR